jgi:hypothetical protein
LREVAAISTNYTSKTGLRQIYPHHEYGFPHRGRDCASAALVPRANDGLSFSVWIAGFMHNP